MNKTYIEAYTFDSDNELQLATEVYETAYIIAKNVRKTAIYSRLLDADNRPKYPTVAFWALVPSELPAYSPASFKEIIPNTHYNKGVLTVDEIKTLLNLELNDFWSNSNE